MPFRWSPREHVQLGRHFFKWLILAAPVGVVVGCAVALFLWSLERATELRFQHPWLLYLLPIAGVGIGLMYHLFGKSVEAGNNLIVDQIHEPGGGVPARMAPLVFIGTVVTHLFGGSAGREGTAVQMGGAIASEFSRFYKLDREEIRLLLMAGVAAGFGAVFGTPITGAIFAMEVLAIGQMNYAAVIPCLIASLVGDAVTTAWKIKHSEYAITTFTNMAVHAPSLDWLLLGKIAIASAAFGLASVIFAELTHSLSIVFRRIVPIPILRPALGGVIVIALVFLLGTRDYLGLGVKPEHADSITIASSFLPGGATPWSWWWKILFTAVTLSCGFKGGEVTPLFFIGAALGNTMARVLHAPTDLLAGLGFVAVFAGATNTPLACTIMAIELFAPHSPGLFSSAFTVYATVACFMSYLLSGHTGIYLSQRIGKAKGDLAALPEATRLRQAREGRKTIRQFFGVE